MARQVNGFVGNFTSLTDLNNKYPPAEHAGCSANFITNGNTVKYWSNGTVWAGADSSVVQALVSVAGNLAAAAVSSTSGTPGEVRRISDGDNAGALVVWAIPQGASTYTWCWWLWPQAAY